MKFNSSNVRDTQKFEIFRYINLDDLFNSSLQYKLIPDSKYTINRNANRPDLIAAELYDGDEYKGSLLQKVNPHSNFELQEVIDYISPQKLEKILNIINIEKGFGNEILNI